MPQSKHRLATDFANHDNVRFLSCGGELLHMATTGPVATVARPLDVGDTWNSDDPWDDAA